MRFSQLYCLCFILVYLSVIIHLWMDVSSKTIAKRRDKMISILVAAVSVISVYVITSGG